MLAAVIQECGGTFKSVKPSDLLGALPETRVEQRGEWRNSSWFPAGFHSGDGEAGCVWAA